jgi:hypothetical protein
MSANPNVVGSIPAGRWNVLLHFICANHVFIAPPSIAMADSLSRALFGGSDAGLTPGEALYRQDVSCVFQGIILWSKGVDDQFKDVSIHPHEVIHHLIHLQLKRALDWEKARADAFEKWAHSLGRRAEEADGEIRFLYRRVLRHSYHFGRRRDKKYRPYMKRKGGKEDMDLNDGWMTGLGMVRDDLDWNGVGDSKEEYRMRKAWGVQPWGDEIDSS